MNIEKSIISILLYDEDSHFYIPYLTEDDFVDNANRDAFRVIKELYEAGEKIDCVKVAHKLSFGEVAIQIYDVNDMFSFSNMKEYVETLKKDTAKRKLKRLLKISEYRIITGEELSDVVKTITDSLNDIESVSSSKLVDVGDIEPNFEDRETVSSGFSNLDKMIGGFKFGELSVWSGKSGQGKSTFLSQVMLEAVERGYNVCAYSGELINEQFQHWLLLQACGDKHIVKKYDTIKQCDVFVPSTEASDKIRKWLKGRFFLYNNQFTGNDNNIIDVFRYAYKTHNCRVFLVDNLMTAKYDTDSRENYYVQQSRFVGELVRFAKTYNVHVHLIAHPKKTQGELTKEDISGSLDITNRADNAFTVNRDEVGTIVKVLKNRSQGIQNQMVRFEFDTKTKRFLPNNNEFARFKVYGWERG